MDLPELVRIHKLAYSASHFTALLPSDVLAAYYGYFLDDNAKIVVAGSLSPGPSGEVGHIEGFAVFGENIPQRIAAFERDYAWQLIAASLRHPLTAAQKVLNRIVSRLTPRDQKKPADFLLLSIAVATPRKGTGAKLLEEVKSQAREQGWDIVGLYVNCDNLGAINAYFRAGFVLKSLTAMQYYMECVIHGN